MKKIALLIAVLTLIISCNNSKKEYVAPKEVPLSERAIPPLPGTAAASANNVIGGAHYICPNNCIGGSGNDAGNCPVCDTAMAHNQGYHAGPNANPASNPNAPTTGPNLKGQYHYTCTQGCAGGADSGGSCSNCGGDLAHNAAYHT